jgi:metal-responsive CopG/Arc/MetJ family transcriptional regulator
MTIWKSMRTICLYLPEELIVEVDAAAAEEYLCRAEYIRRVLRAAAKERNFKAVEKLRKQNPLDPRLLDPGDI